MLIKFKKNETKASAEEAFEQLEPIQQIWLNTSTSKEEFRFAYLPPLYRIFTSLESEQRKEYLSHLAFALARARMGVVLGRKLPFEDQALNRDAYTYALVMAPLLYTYPVEACRENGYDAPALFAVSIAQETLGDKGFTWLRRFPVVYADFLNYFSDHSQSEIHAFIKKVLAHNPAIDEKRSGLSLPYVSFQQSMQKESPVSKTKASVKPEFSPAKYVLWINESVSDGKMAIGDPESIIFPLADGNYFLVLDDCFERFNPDLEQSARNLTRRLRSDGYLMAEKKGQDLYFAEVHGTKRKGIILLGEFIQGVGDIDQQKCLSLI
jgi:hypothetical protein